MKVCVILAGIVVCGFAISASAQGTPGAQSAQNSFAQADSDSAASRLVLSPSDMGQVKGASPVRLQDVVDAMSAELGEIAQAAREGKISKDQAVYLSMERYYVALARFQLLRVMQQGLQPNDAQQSYSQVDATPKVSSSVVTLPTLTCSPDIPEQLVYYLELTPQQVSALQAQVTEECKQVQPLADRLDQSRRKLLSMKMSGQAGDREVQALAAEPSDIMKQLIVMNSQLETKLYSLLTSEQQRRVDGLLRQTLDSREVLPPVQ